MFGPRQNLDNRQPSELCIAQRESNQDVGRAAIGIDLVGVELISRDTGVLKRDRIGPIHKVFGHGRRNVSTVWPASA